MLRCSAWQTLLTQLTAICTVFAGIGKWIVVTYLFHHFHGHLVDILQVHAYPNRELLPYDLLLAKRLCCSLSSPTFLHFMQANFSAFVYDCDTDDLTALLAGAPFDPATMACTTNLTTCQAELLSEGTEKSLLFIAIGVSAGVAIFLQTFLFGRIGTLLTKRLREESFKVCFVRFATVLITVLAPEWNAFSHSPY